jgi:hypothetical protein
MTAAGPHCGSSFEALGAKEKSKKMAEDHPDRRSGLAASGAGANRISAINELAYERSAQRNVALVYALAPNSRADVFILMQLRM